ncbi:MAG: histidine phosphatase family protein, partial [Chloroflexi bacterium]
AEIIAPALGLPIVFDDEVQEERPGEALNMSEREFRAKFGAVAFEQKPFFRIAPGAETWVEFALRAGTALKRITHEHEGKTIVIVCHGGIVDSSFLLFFGLSSLQFPPIFFETHNTSITHWYKESLDLFGFSSVTTMPSTCATSTRPSAFPGKILRPALSQVSRHQSHQPRPNSYVLSSYIP